MCGNRLILLYSNLRCSKLHVMDIVGKILSTEDIRIKGNTTEQLKLCDKEVLFDCKNG
jgi:hypothetical protein